MWPDTHKRTNPWLLYLKKTQRLLMDHYVLLDLFTHLTKEIRRYGFLFFISDDLITKSIKTCCMNYRAIQRSLCLEIQVVCLLFVKWKDRSASVNFCELGMEERKLLSGFNVLMFTVQRTIENFREQAQLHCAERGQFRSPNVVL